jgi:ubiquinol-cytochrome c reductase cytochrome b subunit
MRDVDWGWFIRYMHSTGASAFFIVIYLHMFRALLYGSHRKPRELLWIFGCLIFLLLMAEAFMGYVLPWGNMSYWGAQVIVSLFSSLPVIGASLVEWIRGDYYIADATLNRFFALHVAALPLALIFLVIAHLMALHEVGSNNPDGIEIKKHKGADGHPLDGIRFHPYYTVKDTVGVVGFLLLFCGVIFFAPSFGGLFLESPNFEPANALQTPPHIAPVWYFTPFYAMLRAVPSFAGTQVWGVLVMGGAVLILFFLPWLDRSPVRSVRYRGPIFKFMLGVFVVSFIALGVCGLKPPSGIYPMLARVCTIAYFAFFLLMPWYTKIDRVKPVPERVTGHA